MTDTSWLSHQQWTSFPPKLPGKQRQWFLVLSQDSSLSSNTAGTLVSLFFPIPGSKGPHDTRLLSNWESHSRQWSLFWIQMIIFSQHLCFPSYASGGRFMECSPVELLSRVSLVGREGQIHSHMGLVFLEPLSLSNGDPGSSFRYM